jgi:hypothetical protein
MADWVDNEKKEEGGEQEEEGGRRRWGTAVEVMRRAFIDAARLRATRSLRARLSAMYILYGYDLWCRYGQIKIKYFKEGMRRTMGEEL